MVVATAKNVSPFSSLVCKLSKYICLLGALLHRNTVIDFLVLGCDGKRVNVICN